MIKLNCYTFDSYDSCLIEDHTNTRIRKHDSLNLKKKVFDTFMVCKKIHSLDI